MGAIPQFVEVANQYIAGVLSGKIPANKWVKLACKRQKEDLKRCKSKSSPYLFDVNKASAICKFVELMPHIKGSLAGQNIKLEPWQVFLLTTIYGWVKREDGKRRFRRVYIEVPRGNGKSALSSAIGLYMLTADGEGGAEVYSLATTRNQARIVFCDAQSMSRKRPEMMKALGVHVEAHNINVIRTGSKFEPLSSEASTLDGLNVHFGCIDELHAHKTREVYDVVETGIGKRDNSLLWVITTAGSNRAGICYEARSYVTKMLDRVFCDDSQFGVVYGLDDGDDWTTEESLIKANPNWGISVRKEILLQLQAKAMQMPSAANNFKTKHLNEWVNADSSWMDMRAWQQCADLSLNVDEFSDEDCYISLDLASKVDIAAKIKLFVRNIDGVDHYYAFGSYYLPSETVELGSNSQYQGWESMGLLSVTEGAVTDYSIIEQDLIEECKRFHVVEIPYDPFQATHLAGNLVKEGLPAVEYRQTVLNMSEPMKTLEALVLSKRFHHDGCPILEWMISNVVCHIDAKDNIYPRKERNENKIDGAVALIMGLGRALAHKENQKQPVIGADYKLMFI